MKAPNLFLTLAKYGSREAEDYLTESFVLLLKNLLEHRPALGLALLNKICGLAGDVQFDNPELITISTQVVVDQGRPDIEVRSGSEILVYIEIKHDAALGDGQLEYYKRKLDESEFDHTALVLLTRSLASGQETTLTRNEYHHVCWYDVYRELAGIRNEGAGKICIFLIGEFLSFLEEKQMSLERVGWEYINGVPSLVALINLLEVAILEALPDVKLKKTGGWEWLGFRLDDTYYCGIRYKEPLIVVFEDNLGADPSYKHDLDLENDHFFSLNQAEQLECLVEFVKQSFENKTADHQFTPRTG